MAGAGRKIVWSGEDKLWILTGKHDLVFSQRGNNGLRHPHFPNPDFAAALAPAVSSRRFKFHSFEPDVSIIVN